MIPISSNARMRIATGYTDMRTGMQGIAGIGAGRSKAVWDSAESIWDSQISVFLIHHAGWAEASMDGQALLSRSAQARGGGD
ncbi:transposase [Bradyrhizobium canariense]|uniref:transposase n=1 Tax=Bradyrhizobium canariense TaxID=255045 RepID=UPI001177A70F|nr:transposase [Bradyrhizobium canariense]